MNRYGFGTAALIPWLLAAALLTVTILLWSSRGADGGAESDSSDRSNLEKIRAELAAARSENSALLHELEWLRTTQPSGDAGCGLATTSGMPATEAKREEDHQALVRRLENALGGGDDAKAKAEAAHAILDALRTGDEGFAALREVYSKASDPHARKLLLGSMVFSGNPQMRDFVVDQVQSEKDPEARKILMAQAARFASPGSAGDLAPTFIQSVDSAEDSETRIAAIRGLRYAPGAEAPEALMRAANDPSEDVRIAAMDVIASRAAGQQTLEMLVANDPSPRVRQFVQCRLLMSKEIH